MMIPLEIRHIARAGTDVVELHERVVAAPSSHTVEYGLPKEPPAVAAVRQIVEALLDSRDFLAYQLAHEQGCMSDDDFQEIVGKYLAVAHPPFDPVAVDQKTFCLSLLIPDRLDVDIVSAACRCDIDTAENAMRRVANRFLAAPGASLVDFKLVGPRK